MRKIIFALLTVFLFSSCAVTKNGMIGEFKGQTPWMGSFVPKGEMILSLKSDETFSLNWHHVDYTGKWQNKNYILLKFDAIADSIFLRSATIGDSVREIRIINKNKLKMDGNIILKRQK